MALTADVKIQRYGTPDETTDVRLVAQPMKTNVKIFAGSIGVTDVNGFAKPASSVATTDTAWGVVLKQVDNTGGASGAQSVTFERGVFFFASSTGADTIAQSNIGQTVYVVDETHVGLGSSSRPKAGTVMFVDANLGVAVKFGTV